MLLQSLRALCLAPGGSGSIWKYLEALVRLPGVCGRVVCSFGTEVHFADVVRELSKSGNKVYYYLALRMHEISD